MNNVRLWRWVAVVLAVGGLVAGNSSAQPRPAGAKEPMVGQIVVKPDNPAWLFRYAGNGQYKPFFLCGPGDPEDFLFRGQLQPDGTRQGDQMDLIRKLKGTGANCIYLMSIRSHGGDGEKTHNPFVGHDPAKGVNAKVLDQWETWFAAMDEAGIVIFFFVYDDSCRVWKTGDEVGPEEKQYLQTLVNRFKHHKNLIWCVAEEYQERFSPKAVSAIAAEIRKADEFAHPIAVHKLSGVQFAELADDPNIDQFAIQLNAKTAGDLHSGMLKAWKLAEGKYNLNMSECLGHGKADDIRQRSWACAMGGAYVMVFQMDIAGTKMDDLKDCGRLVEFFEATNFFEMAPHDELAAGDTKYVLAKPGHSYIAYAPAGKDRLGLKNLVPGTYRFRWMDIPSGKTVMQERVAVGPGEQAWARPEGVGAEAAVHIAPAE